jgi:hypothetical protein
VAATTIGIAVLAVFLWLFWRYRVKITKRNVENSFANVTRNVGEPNEPQNMPKSAYFMPVYEMHNTDKLPEMDAGYRAELDAGLYGQRGYS